MLVDKRACPVSEREEVLSILTPMESPVAMVRPDKTICPEFSARRPMEFGPSATIE